METSTVTRIVQLSPPLEVSMANEWFDFARPEHFWFEWRFAEIIPLLPRDSTRRLDLFEIGCGNGVVLKQLETLDSYNLTGCDLNSEALAATHSQVAQLLLYNVFDFNPTLVGRFDGVLALDVVEHLDADLEFLNACVKHCKPGGRIIINVPACPACFSRYDERAGHKRRYTKASLEQLMASAGLQDVNVRYWGALMLPILFLRKILLRFIPGEKTIERGFQPAGFFQEQLLRFLMRVERMFGTNPWFGSSLVAVGTRKAL